MRSVATTIRTDSGGALATPRLATQQFAAAMAAEFADGADRMVAPAVE